MSCADVQTIQPGNGVKTQFSFDFPYISVSEIQVSFWNATTEAWDEKLTIDPTYPWQVSSANPTIVEFTSNAPPAPTVPVDPAEPTVDNVRIRRVTNLDDIRALFNSGSAIRSDDLNRNFEQLRYAIQEANCQDSTGSIIPGGTIAGTISMAGNRITTLGTPILGQDATTKDYVDAGVNGKAPIESPTFTGTVTIPSGASISGFAPLASPTFTGTVTIPSGASISGFAPLANPTFTGTVTIPSGASISGFAPLASPTFTGTPTVPSLNGGPLAGFRNAIINGNFDIWQRGTSFTASEYGADRWLHGRFGTTHTISRGPFALGQTDVPNEPTYFCRTVVSSVAASGNYSALIQRIEGVRSFAGQQVTVSFWARADASMSISMDFLQYFGTGGSPSLDVSAIGATKIAIGIPWQKITVTASIPSISGKTIGTNNNDALHLYIWFDASDDDNARTVSLGHQSGTFDIAQVQIERGPVATPFERRSYGQELALCQRYYMKYTGHRQAGYTTAGNAITQYLVYPVVMRTAPNLVNLGGGTSFNASALNFINPSPIGFGLELVAAATGAVGAFDNTFQASAEL